MPKSNNVTEQVNLDKVAREINRKAWEKRQPMIEKARHDVNAFIEYVLEDESAEPLKQGEIHTLFQDWIEEAWRNGVHAMIIAPWGQGKSIQCIGRIAYEIGRDPNIRIKLICANDATAIDRVVATAEILKSEKFSHVFPDCPIDNADQWSQKRITVGREGTSIDATLEANSILGSKMGGRADIIIYDDVVDYKNAVQDPALRAKVKLAYKNSWMSRLEKGGRVIYIATLWHTFDLSSELLKKTNYAILKVRVSADLERLEVSTQNAKLIGREDVDYIIALWEKWNKKALQSKRNDVGPSAFARGYFMKVMSDSDKTFQNFPLIYQDVSWKDLMDKRTRIYCGVDLSAANRKGVVLWTGGVNEQGYKFPIKILHGAWNGTQTVERFKEIEELYCPSIYLVEDNALQSVIIEMIRTNYSSEAFTSKIKPFTTTGVNKHSQEVGLPALDVEFANKKWIFPLKDKEGHDISCECGLCRWEQEMIDHPLAMADDTVMASWFFRRAAEAGTMKIKHASTGVRRELIDAVF